MADFARMTRTIWVSIPGRSSYWRDIMRGAVDRLRSIPDLVWAALDDFRALRSGAGHQRCWWREFRLAMASSNCFRQAFAS